MLVTIGSMTTATRAANIIRKNLGISAQVVSTPTKLNRGGCSYSVKFNEKYELAVRKIVEAHSIPTRRWYRESYNGNERVYDDIS